jgi:hypothetical protein
VSGEFLARLKAARPDVDWDAELARAYALMRKADRNPWNRFRHWVHAQAYPALHQEKCLKCRGGQG